MSLSPKSVILTLALVAGCKERAPAPAPTAGSAAHAGSAHAPAGSAALPPVPAEDAEALGALHFDVSGGTPLARQHFQRGLLALHSFWYEEATQQFDAAIAADPSFAMAYWGLAMSKSKLLWNDDDIAGGRDALKRMPNPQALPPHDQAWVMAAVSLFRRGTPDVRASRQDFRTTLEALHKQFPSEESGAFLALANLALLRPNAPDELVLRERAAQLAFEVLAKNPKHPGAAHYLIHAYDTVALAAKALPVAQQYAKIAPAAFHARHMPAHIFSRLGRWKEAMDSCQAAWDSSVAWAERAKLPADYKDFHSLTWMIEISFERGRRGDADRAMALYADLVKAGLSHSNRAAYANQVASYLARTGEWARVDELLAPLDAPAATGDHKGHAGHSPADPHAGHGGHGGHGEHGRAAAGSAAGSGAGAPAGGPPTDLFEKRAVLGARARAAAMRKDKAALERLIKERAAVDDQLRPFLVATQSPELVASMDALKASVQAMLRAYARGDDRALVAALRPLAKDQEQEFTGEGAAGGVLFHEDIGLALMRLGDAQGALTELRAVLAQHPGRARSLLHAARAATKLGDAATAKQLYGDLVALWADADATTEGLDEAKRAIAAAP